MRFHDRADAGRLLAARLDRFKDDHPIILALPRGGVPVAHEVAKALGAPLDVVLVRKIGVPYQPELAMGAIAEGMPPTLVRNNDILRLIFIDDADFDAASKKQWAEIERRQSSYRQGQALPDIKDKTVIIIDDGVATGATIRAALKSVRARGAKRTIVAAPVIAADTLVLLQSESDEVVYLDAPESFGAIGAFYDDFNQVSDETVIALLRPDTKSHLEKE